MTPSLEMNKTIPSFPHADSLIWSQQVIAHVKLEDARAEACSNFFAVVAGD
jgi:hypothetical protein